MLKPRTNIFVMCSFLLRVNPLQLEKFVGSWQTGRPTSVRNCFSLSSRAKAISVRGTTASMKMMWRAKRMGLQLFRPMLLRGNTSAGHCREVGGGERGERGKGERKREKWRKKRFSLQKSGFGVQKKTKTGASGVEIDQ